MMGEMDILIYLVSAASATHKLYERKRTILLHSKEMNALNPAGLCGHGMWLEPQTLEEYQPDAKVFSRVTLCGSEAQM